MKATLFSLAIAIAVMFVPSEFIADGNTTHLSYLLLFLFSLFLVVIPIVYAFSWTPLQKGELNSTPRLLEMLEKDKWLSLNCLALYLSPLIALVLTAISAFGAGLDKFFLLPAWILLLGFSIDRLRYLVHRVGEYLNPFKVLDLFKKEAETQIRETNLDAVIGSIESVAEVAIRSIERTNSSLASQAVQELKEIGQNFLKSSKTYASIDKELDEYQKSHVDKVAYTFNYLLARLADIAEKAIQKKSEPLVSQIISTLGRLAIASSAYDLTLTNQPISTITEVVLRAVNQGMREIGFKGEILLTEVVKNIVKEVDLTYLEIKTPFSAVINSLDTIAKELFRQDKSTPVGLLTQSFSQLKEIFANPPISTHQDGPLLQAENQSKLDEYNTLAAVLSTLPNPQDIVANLKT